MSGSDEDSRFGRLLRSAAASAATLSHWEARENVLIVDNMNVEDAEDAEDAEDFEDAEDYDEEEVVDGPDNLPDLVERPQILNP